jgi:hypothetical protein
MKLIRLPDNLQKLSASLAPHFDEITDAFRKIKEKLQEYSDGKLLKGDEIIGWLGEIYGKMILNGKLVSDKYNYDIITQNMRISVKARKGTASGWNTTSIIPKVKGNDCPTHLMFIQFKNTYSLFRVWLFPWEDLYNNKRFIEKKVRGEHRGYYIKINKNTDEKYLIYCIEP